MESSFVDLLLLDKQTGFPHSPFPIRYAFRFNDLCVSIAVLQRLS